MPTARIGGTGPIAGALLLLFAWSAAIPVHAAAPVRIRGMVRDALGRGLPDVEVLFARFPVEAYRPDAVTRSSGTGSFQVSDLLPGHYRVAALKDGYRTAVGQIDTLAHNSIDLVLYPAVEIDEAELPRDSSWALRLPRRGLLHDVEPATESGSSEARVARGGLGESVSMEVAQLFSVAAKGSSKGQSGDAKIEPSETHVSLASSLGERGNIVVEGRREHFSPSAAQDGASSATEDNASVRFKLNYDTSPDGRFAFSAYFDQADYELAAHTPGGASPLERQHQIWGYDARWSRQFGASRQIAVEVAQRDISLQDARPELTHRAVSARGSFHAVVDRDHELRVAVEAQMLEPSATAAAPIDSTLDRPLLWSVQAEVQDTWAVTTPFSIIYGLGYKQAIVSESAMVVPRVGGDLTLGGWNLHSEVSYHAVQNEDPASAAEGGDFFRPGTPLGYMAEVEIPVARNVRLRGGMSYSPIQLGHGGSFFGDDFIGERPLYLTDGNTAVEEQHVVLVEERGSTRIYLELSAGTAEGAVIPLIPFGGAWPVGPDGRLYFRNGRVGVLFPEHGTELRVEYRRVETLGARESDSTAESLQESVEVRVRKDMTRLPVPGNWRLLLALRVGSVDSGELDGYAADGAETVSALNQRVSAGVSVLF